VPAALFRDARDHVEEEERAFGTGPSMLISDAGLVVAAVVSIVLTAGVIARDTRHRLGLERQTARKVANP
jgi:hypothetical protein